MDPLLRRRHFGPVQSTSSFCHNISRVGLAVGTPVLGLMSATVTFNYNLLDEVATAYSRTGTVSRSSVLMVSALNLF